MTCQKCVKRVTELLTPHFTDVRVALDSGTLTVTAHEPVSAQDINTLLEATSYRVRPASKATLLSAHGKVFLPLIIMTLLVILFTAAHTWWQGFSFHTVMQYFMAGYFFLFGGLKVYAWRGFIASYRRYDALAAYSLWYAALYPFLEIVLGVLYYFAVFPIAVNLFVFLLFMQKAESVYRAVQQGTTSTCACLGGAFSVPLTRVTVFEDVLMALMAFVMLCMYL
jgi:copper chaperone CopZ